MRDKLAKLIFDCWLDHVAETNGPAPTAMQYADYLISHGVTFAEDNNAPGKERTLSFSIKEGMDLEGATCSRVSVQYLYEGKVYGTYVDFKKAKLDEDDIAEAFKELAYSYTMALECLEAEGYSK